MKAFELVTDRKDWPWYVYVLLPFVPGYWIEGGDQRVYAKKIGTRLYPIMTRTDKA